MVSGVDLARWASLFSRPAAAACKPRFAQLLHSVLAFQVQPAALRGPAGSLLLLIAAAPSESARVGYIIEVDTYRLASGDRIYIAGIDAPANEDDSKRFKERLGKLVKHKPVVKSPNFLGSALDPLRTCDACPLCSLSDCWTQQRRGCQG